MPVRTVDVVRFRDPRVAHRHRYSTPDWVAPRDGDDGLSHAHVRRDWTPRLEHKRDGRGIRTRPRLTKRARPHVDDRRRPTLRDHKPRLWGLRREDYLRRAHERPRLMAWREFRAERRPRASKRRRAVRRHLRQTGPWPERRDDLFGLLLDRHLMTFR